MICAIQRLRRGWHPLWAAVICLGVTGCHATPRHSELASALPPAPVPLDVPRELSKVVLPDYTIEPPDILSIQTIHAVPKAPYHLKTLDVLNLRVLGTLPEAPLMGAIPVEPGGTVNLGAPYGSVHVAGMDLQQAQQAIEEHLKTFLQQPEVTVTLAELGASQWVAGDFLVGPDGTVTLGSYGKVPVVALTVGQAKLAIEQHLSQFLDEVVVSVSVFAYNSKMYYVVLEGGGLGDAVYRFPVTGNDTVLDAIAQVNGLEAVSSKQIWVSRPSGNPACPVVLPVDWAAITKDGIATTNYQILPGDRVFIAENKWVAFDNQLAKFLAPIERIFGFSILGAETVTRFSGNVLEGGGNPRGSAFSP